MTPPCPSCNSAKGYYRDVDNQTARCLHCLSPVEVDLEGGEPTTKSSFTAEPVKDKAQAQPAAQPKAQDKAVRGPKEQGTALLGEKGPEVVNLPKGTAVKPTKGPKEPETARVPKGTSVQSTKGTAT